MNDIDTYPCIPISFAQEQNEDALVKPFLGDYEEEVIQTLSPLTQEEQEEREECEKVIDEFLVDFISVGLSLFTIKSGKLYRSTHHSFEEYCKDKFGITRVHANRLIKHQQIVEVLESEPNGSVLIPSKETHSRVLAGCTPDQVKEIAKTCKKKVGEKSPSAKDWEAAKKEVLPPKGKESSAKPKRTSAKAAPPEDGDSFHCGFEGLPSLRELQEMAEALCEVSMPAAKKDQVLKLVEYLGQYAQWQEANYEGLREAA